MKDNYTHFGELIDRLQIELSNRLFNYFSIRPSKSKISNPNQWLEIVFLVKSNQIKILNKFYKKEIIEQIRLILHQIIFDDSIITRIAYINNKKISKSDYDINYPKNRKKTYSKKDFDSCIKFSFNYFLEGLKSDDTDLIDEYKYYIRRIIGSNPISEIMHELLKFRNERDWEQFHNPKDLALAINVEAGELLELFLWKNADDANKEKVKEELADIFAYAFLLADKYKLDIKEIVLEKIRKNADKYPVDKSKGNAKKYNEL